MPCRHHRHMILRKAEPVDPLETSHVISFSEPHLDQRVATSGRITFPRPSKSKMSGCMQLMPTYGSRTWPCIDSIRPRCCSCCTCTCTSPRLPTVLLIALRSTAALEHLEGQTVDAADDCFDGRVFEQLIRVLREHLGAQLAEPLCIIGRCGVGEVDGFGELCMAPLKVATHPELRTARVRNVPTSYLTAMAKKARKEPETIEHHELQNPAKVQQHNIENGEDVARPTSESQ